jgi:hypothetical protein
MARELNLQIPQFKSSTQILGCVAHVINLAAKIGIGALGSIDYEDEGHIISMADTDVEPKNSSANNPMNIRSLVSPPDGASINMQTILKRIHGLCTWVRFSPQRREKFSVDVNYCQPKMIAKKIKCLEIDVPTRWNSTYSMLKRAILLEKTCTHFCNCNSEVSKFILSPAKWDQAKNLTKLLEPLYDATIILSGLQYPTLNKALPVYIVLIKHLDLVQRGLYNQSQLIPPALQMIQKFNQYIQEALKKPMYICARDGRG